MDKCEMEYLKCMMLMPSDAFVRYVIQQGKGDTRLAIQESEKDMINHKHYHEATKEITEYRAIDGNWVKHPEGYCTRYNGYLTKKQMAVHGCMKRHGGICGRFQTVKGEYVRRMNQQQFYDKMISRMDKMCGSLEKIVRTLEAMQKSEQLSRSFTPSEALVVPMNTHVHLEAKSTDSSYGNVTIE